MKSKLIFYLAILILVVLDSILITSSNLLGQIGLFIYKYNYLWTFPRALMTVLLVIGIAAAISEVIQLLVRKQMMKRVTGFIVLLVLLLLSIALLIKTEIDFSTWMYKRTGSLFKYGGYLLSLLLIAVFGFGAIRLFRFSRPWPESTVMKEGGSKD